MDSFTATSKNSSVRLDMTRKYVITMIDKFEEQLHRDLHQFLQSMKEVDERLPECPDSMAMWPVCTNYTYSVLPYS